MHCKKNSGCSKENYDAILLKQVSINAIKPNLTNSLSILQLKKYMFQKKTLVILLQVLDPI